MRSSKTNFTLLSLAIIYFILAFVQMSIPKMLPASLYVGISFVAVVVSISEVTISMLRRTIELNTFIIKYDSSLIQAQKRAKSITENATDKTCISDSIKELSERVFDEVRLKKADQSISRAKKLIIAVEFIEVFMSVAILVITPLKAIPYDFNTNKLLSSLSLISFGLIFFAIYSNNTTNLEPLKKNTVLNDIERELEKAENKLKTVGDAK